ncbi:hypothetical protein EYV94_14000 [Puteibacter caeruleilacunae]|nr:hypothetical protein EYV94_14000 [Puteibacter caeruleilacunae]
MKQLLVILSVLCSLNSFAQDKFYKEGEGFPSIFQKLKQAEKKGTVSGMIQYKLEEGDSQVAVFTKNEANLNIRPDKNEIYDVSFKEYITENAAVKLKYTTYNYSNAFHITTEQGTFQLSLIDGACLAVIKGIDYEYIETDKEELLVMNFSDDVGLSQGKCNTKPDFFIQKGSTLIFRIQK